MHGDLHPVTRDRVTSDEDVTWAAWGREYVGSGGRCVERQDTCLDRKKRNHDFRLIRKEHLAESKLWKRRNISCVVNVRVTKILKKELG